MGLDINVNREKTAGDKLIVSIWWHGNLSLKQEPLTIEIGLSIKDFPVFAQLDKIITIKQEQLSLLVDTTEMSANWTNCFRKKL